MSYLLDSGILAMVIRNIRPASLHFTQNIGRLYLSVISVTEVETWLLRPRTPSRFAQVFITLSRDTALLDVTEPIAHRAALSRAALRRQGRSAGLADLLIAATALEHGLTLVTHAAQAFVGITGLTMTDWTAP